MRIGLHLFAFTLLVLPGGALEDEDAPAYAVQAWTTDEGLPQNTVTAVLQSRDGYLWLGTFGGLARFDGVRFTIFDISNTEALGSNRILSLLEDSQGALWIGTQGYGVTRYENGTFTHFGELDGAPTGDIWAIVESEGGALWFAGKGLTRYAGGRFEQRLVEDVATTTFCIRAEGPETLWLGTGSGLIHYVRGSVRRYTQEDGLPKNLIWWVDRDRDGTLWASTSSGIAVLRDGRFSPVTLPAGTDPGVVRDVWPDGEGRRWVAGAGLYSLGSFADERPFEPRSLPLLKGAALRSLAVDREASLWIGTEEEGLVRTRASPFSYLDGRHGVESAPWLLVSDPDGDDVWIGMSSGELLRSTGGPAEPAPGALAEAFTTSGGGLCLLRDGGIWVLNSRFATHFATRVASVLADDPIERFEHGLKAVFDPIHEDADGVLWFGTTDAVCSLRGTEITQYPLPPERRGPVRLYRGSAGRLWVTTSDGLGLFQGGSIEFEPLEPFPKGAIRAIYEEQGTLWITTYGSGLGRYADGELTWITEADGLPDNSLGGFLADDNGHFWINSNRGVFCVNRAELDSKAEGTSAGLSCRLLRTGEGNGGSACRAADGRLWFPTLYGVAIIDPEQVSKNPIPPQVHIERLEVDGEPLDLRADIVLPPEMDDLVIEYAGLSFVDPKGMRFRYRLVGNDDDWVDVGPRRRAYYTNIPPGSYRFEVIACNDDGVWNEVGASLELELLPYFYETPWFRGLCFGAVGIALVSFYLARTRDIRRRNVALRTEIRDRESAEAELRESEERYRVVAEAATDAILTIDEQGSIVYANPATERIFGCAPTDCIGLPLNSLMPDRLDENKELDSNELWEGRELIGRHDDGHTFPIEVSLGVLRPLDGRPRITCIVRDITERRRTEEERARLEERLRESKKMEAMGRLAGGISHDFNNILTAMISHADLLDERIRGGSPDGSPDGSLEHVEEIKKCTELAFSLTNQLLAFSRRQVVQPTVLQPSEVLSVLEPMLRRLIRGDIDLVVEVADDVGPIRADVGQLEQIIMNLVLNGCDAMPDGGVLTVKALGVELDPIYAACNPQASVGPHVLIVVSDTGVGISKDVLPHLFEPFFTTKAVGHGTGLGLASVHGIVQQSGGHITVTSEPEKGTTFRVYLPRDEHAPSRIAPPRTEVRGGEPRSGTETVLVCDDYAAVRRATHMILSNHGYDALSADGPQEALRIAKDHPQPIKLLITDVVMPGMNGPQLAKEITALQPDIRVLFVSGYTSDVVIHDGVTERRTSFLQKPYVFKELLQRVRELLDAPVEA
jgi:PAS domain S-box-containing protein